MDKPDLYVRDGDLATIGQIDDYTELTVTSTYNDVGAWTLTLSAESPKVALLDPRTNPGGGIFVVRRGTVVFSGPVRSFQWTQSADSGPGTVTVAGPDDNIILADRVVWPAPLVEIDVQNSYFYAHPSADAETIMRDLVWRSATDGALTARQVPGLTLAANANRGRVHVPAKMRLGTLLQELQAESVASQTGSDRTTRLGFRVIQTATSLEFQVFASADRIDTARFGFDLGNLAGATYTLTAPTATYVVLGAGATALTSGARVSTHLVGYNRADTIWPGRIEKFVESSETDLDPAGPDFTVESARLDDAADQALDDGAGQVGLALVPIDTDRLVYGVDYFLGDLVSAVTPFTTVSERVVQVGLTWNATDGESFAAGVGTTEGTITIPSSSSVTNATRPRAAASLTRIAEMLGRRRVRPPYWARVKAPNRRVR